MVGGMESSSTCVTGSGPRRMISVRKGSTFFLGVLGEGEYLVGDGDGDLTGESGKEGKGSTFFLGALGVGGYLTGDGDGGLTGEPEKVLLLTAIFVEEGGEETGDRGDWEGEVESLDFSGERSWGVRDLEVLKDESLDSSGERFWGVSDLEVLEDEGLGKV